MAKTRILFALALCLGVAGCYSGQKKQLAVCEAGASHQGEGQPLKSIQACMDQAGYRFVGYASTTGATIQCDLASVIRGVPGDGTEAQCFEPKSWVALKIYRMEMPVQPPQPAPAS